MKNSLHGWILLLFALSFPAFHQDLTAQKNPITHLRVIGGDRLANDGCSARHQVKGTLLVDLSLSWTSNASYLALSQIECAELKIGVYDHHNGQLLGVSAPVDVLSLCSDGAGCNGAEKIQPHCSNSIYCTTVEIPIDFATYCQITDNSCRNLTVEYRLLSAAPPGSSIYKPYTSMASSECLGNLFPPACFCHEEDELSDSYVQIIYYQCQDGFDQYTRGHQETPSHSPLLPSFKWTKDKVTTPNNARIFPNPTSGDFQIEFYSTITEKVDIVILNSEGKSILQVAKSVNKGINSYQLSLQGFPPGLYLSRINTKNGSWTNKIVKHK